MEKTNLKQTTCTRLIDELLREKLIRESGVAESSGGRRPMMYDLNSTLYFSVGIDISRTFINVLLLDVHLNVIETERLSIHKESTPKSAIKFLHHAIEQMLNKHKIDENQFVGIGIGSVEPIDRESGIIKDPLYFPNDQWKDVKIVDALKAKWDTTVILDSGINSAVLAEYQKGYHAMVGNMSYIIAGMGLRISVINDHRLLKSLIIIVCDLETIPTIS